MPHNFADSLIASLSEVERAGAIERAATEGWTVLGARKKLGKGAQVSNNSGENEWYTPAGRAV